VHGVGGVVGVLLTGVFATTEANVFAGAFYGNPALILYQLAAIGVTYPTAALDRSPWSEK
jgi:Amt family ammonium transporter